VRQTPQSPAMHTCINPPREGSGVSPGPYGCLGPYSGSGCCILHAPARPLPWGKEQGLPGVVACWASAWRAVAQSCRAPSLWPHLGERPLRGSLIVASFPALMLGNSATLRHPRSSCDPGDPETTLSHLGFCPTLPPKHLSGRDVPHRSRPLKVAILHSRAISLSGSRLLEAPSPPSFTFPSDSRLRPSYLAKSGLFPICRIAAILFLDLWLSSQVFRMI